MYLLAAVLVVATLAHAEEGLVVLSILLGVFFVVRPSLEGDKTTNGTRQLTKHESENKYIIPWGTKNKWTTKLKSTSQNKDTIP